MRRPLIFLALAAIVYVGAVHVPELRAADANALYGFMGLTQLPGAGHTIELISLFDPAPFAALLTVFTVNALLMVGSHYPSDVLGGLLLASAWGSAAVLALGERDRVSVRGPLLATGALFALFALAVLPRTGAAVDYAVANTTFVLSALTIAAAALVLSGSVPAPTGARRRLPPGSPRARG